MDFMGFVQSLEILGGVLLLAHKSLEDLGDLVLDVSFGVLVWLGALGLSDESEGVDGVVQALVTGFDADGLGEFVAAWGDFDIRN